MKVIKPYAVALALSGVAAAPANAQELAEVFSAHEFTGSDTRTLRYRLFVPSDVADGTLPLVVYLHGANGFGSDNRQQLLHGNAVALGLFASPELQARHPAFVLAPQATSPHGWSGGTKFLSITGELVVELVEALTREYPIDASRVYLTGISMGGSGTWDIASKRPDLFAAAVPSCAAGSPSRAEALGDLPVWAFHGALDTSAIASGWRDTIAALLALGGPARHTEYPDLGHDACTRPYLDPEMPEWLFAQGRQ